MAYQTRRLRLVLGLIALPAAALAQSPPDIAKMSLEELMNIRVTSASRKEQRAGDTAAAIFVITHEDILSSGLTTIPDLLRLVPGVDVAQVNANNWAVSIRGFNNLFANKLLVLIDGRSIYDRVFSGVLWNSADLMIDDIDRVEVIRGPAAAMWGANAMNGVINIVTMPAAETKGGLVRVEGGGGGTQAAARYGGTAGSASYRVFGQWTGADQSVIPPNQGADDGSRVVTTGFRADWTARPGGFSVEGGYTGGRMHGLWPNLDPQTAAVRPLADDPSTVQVAHLIGRWTRTRAGGATMLVQTYVDVSDRHEPPADYGRTIFDLDAVYHTSVGSRQDVVVGAGLRTTSDSYSGNTGFALTPDHDRTSLGTAFLLDEIALNRRLSLTLGSQFQYESSSGAGVQPTARLMWKADTRQRVWLAVSRALRTPSRYEQGVRVDFPPVDGPGGLPLVVTVSGNPEAETENVVAFEAGYRIEIGTTASIDVTGFEASYDHLHTTETQPLVVEFLPTPQVHVTSVFGNELQATTRGMEVAGHWTPARMWRVYGSYTAFHLSPDLSPASTDPSAATSDGTAPRTQWQMRSTFTPVSRATFGAGVFRVGPLTHLQVKAYTRTDVTAEWRLSRRVSVMVIGQNLLDRTHTEMAGGDSFVLPTLVPRSVGVRLRWTPR